MFMTQRYLHLLSTQLSQCNKYLMNDCLKEPFSSVRDILGISTSSRESFVVPTAPTKRTMIGASPLVLFASLQLSSVTGEDYIINQEDPDFAVVRNSDFV